MANIKTRFIAGFLLAFATVILSGCNRQPSSKGAELLPQPVAIASDAEATELTMRFLEERVKNDKDDFIALNKLAGYYLQQVRETGNLNYLELATRAAKNSLAAMPAEQNAGGLTVLAQAEFASHEFAASRDHAKQLIEADSRKSSPFIILSDSLLELGDYDKAAQIFQQLEKKGMTGQAIESRLARLALLRGDTEEAKQRFANAVIYSENQSIPSRESVAWSRWQLGEVYFSTGDYQTAEKHYRDALTTFPDYYRALASLGRVRAAQGDFSGAIENYERATRILPDPGYVAALGDLYQLVGKEKEAQAQYALVEQISKISISNGSLYNRQVALFYADHDLKAEEAYAQAKAEYETRRDIYGADALAWTALKAGKLAEAQAAIKEALKLNTRDAKLFYHSGMIAKAAGDLGKARDDLKRALALNPQFDALQSPKAKQALESLQ
jgi:tetratricopeptide (TPR) repeat protein